MISKSLLNLLNFLLNSVSKNCYQRLEAGDVLTDVLIFLAISALMFLYTFFYKRVVYKRLGPDFRQKLRTN